jgi:hypothetical protein
LADSAAGSGGTLPPSVEPSQVFHIRDGKVTEVWTQHADLYTMDAFWSLRHQHLTGQMIQIPLSDGLPRAV